MAKNLHANILAATATTKKVTGKIINIACGKSYSVLDLLNAINEALSLQSYNAANASNASKSSKASNSVEPISAPARKGDIKHSLADITLAYKLLKYEVKVDFDEGICRTVHMV